MHLSLPSVNFGVLLPSGTDPSILIMSSAYPHEALPADSLLYGKIFRSSQIGEKPGTYLRSNQYRKTNLAARQTRYLRREHYYNERRYLCGHRRTNRYGNTRLCGKYLFSGIRAEDDQKSSPIFQVSVVSKKMLSFGFKKDKEEKENNISVSEIACNAQYPIIDAIAIFCDGVDEKLDSPPMHVAEAKECVT